MRVNALVGTLVLWPVCSFAADWCSVDSSSFSFETTLEGEALPGEFRDFDVVLQFDPAHSDEGSLRVTVDLAAADMGDPEMNGILADPVWFHSARFEEAIFRSDTIVARDDGAFVADGVLSLKGREQPVSVPFVWQNSAGAAEMRGELVLRRTDFDVGSGEWADGDAIGLDVRLKFDIRLAHCE